MDVWVNFTNASKWQAEGIFKCFFPCKKAPDTVAENAAKTAGASAQTSDKTPIEQRNMPRVKRKQTSHAVPVLEEDELNTLAKRFAENIPENEMSVSSIMNLWRRAMAYFLSMTGRQSTRLSAQEQDSPS